MMSLTVKNKLVLTHKSYKSRYNKHLQKPTYISKGTTICEIHNKAQKPNYEQYQSIRDKINK